ncbi:RNA polymerase sigma factor [Bordetella ansorpii]|uniref:RNA polymerase sigma factor n=1 Tax=Bordetella ansorpii TaxID=288768 RepID=A0A157QVC2_9BORD|nr:sigma-70 family RNA polymerase sigma factor [Bordetella ansorpii]SAI49618.1 RNA polymerase sigma factor [Bordetella ansorpii]
MSSFSAPATSVQALYEGNHGWLHQWLRRRLACNDDAADLAQDTFVRVLQKPEELPSLREPRAYLVTIARGLVNDLWRRRSLESAWLDALAALPGQAAPSPEEQLAMCQALQELDRMLAGLAPKAREVFVLSQLEGLSYAQIAERLGLSERTIKRYMAQAFEHCLVVMD